METESSQYTGRQTKQVRANATKSAFVCFSREIVVFDRRFRKVLKKVVGDLLSGKMIFLMN